MNSEITQRKRSEEERERLIAELQLARGEIKTLSGILPVCSYCKKIRDHSDADFSHGLCDDCLNTDFRGSVWR